MSGGPEYLVEIKDTLTRITIYSWSGYAANEYDALVLAEAKLLQERADQETK